MFCVRRWLVQAAPETSMGHSVPLGRYCCACDLVPSPLSFLGPYPSPARLCMGSL